MMKKLKQRKRTPNGVAPSEAANCCCRIGWTDEAECGGIEMLLQKQFSVV